ncbi:MAG: calcium-binding protein [Desulfovibrionaceae bacterium]|nr:calcium-binding protein [Desulfovibrionaceae bacterium]
MSNNANTNSLGKILVAPAPPNDSKKIPVTQKYELQDKTQTKASIALYVDRPDGECPGYTPVELSVEITKPENQKPIENQKDGRLLAYSDGTETLNSPITGLRNIFFTDNMLSSDYYTRPQKPFENLIDSTHKPPLSSTTQTSPNPGLLNSSYLFIGTPNEDTINTSTSDNSVTISGQLSSDVLTGSNFADLIFGGYIGTTEEDRTFTSTISIDSNTNTIVGGLGNDTIIAGSSSDLIWAGVNNDNTAHGGNNLIYTGGHQDTVYTGSGNNTVHVSNGSHTTITATTEQALINASSGNDSIIISASGKNTINAGDGNNTISVEGTGVHTITAGAGNDSILLTGGSSNSVSAGTGNNTISISSTGNNTIHSTGLDTITLATGVTQITTSGTGTVSLNAGDGNNSLTIQNTGVTTILSGSGNDTITSSDGIDSISVSGGNNQIQSGNGNDTITTGNGNDSITSTSGNNSITSTGGDNTIASGSGNDIIISGDGADSISVSGGDNQIQSGNGNDSITTGDGADSISVSGGNNQIQSGNGNDTITTGIGNDSITSTGGDNNIQITGGSNTIILGTGNDIITSGDGADSISVSGGNNQIQSGNGNDTITTGNGNDSITSTGGDNSIQIIGGSNTIVSGTGNDTITSGNGADSISVSGGNNQIQSGAGNDTIITGIGNDSITITGGDNSIQITGGNNTITSGTGNDTLSLGSGTHTITMAGGNNSISLTNSTVSLTTQDTTTGNDTVYTSGSIQGTLDLGGGKADILMIANNTSFNTTQTHIKNTEAIYVSNSTTPTQIDQSIMVEAISTSANFYNVSMAGNVLTNQMLISGSTSASGNVLQFNLSNTDALILGTQNIQNVGTVYIVSISPPGVSGTLMLIPSHFMDNVTITKNGSTPTSLSSLIGSVYDQSHSSYIQITPGADHTSLTTGGSLNQAINGTLQTTVGRNIDDTIIEHDINTAIISEDSSHEDSEQTYSQASSTVKSSETLHSVSEQSGQSLYEVTPSYELSSNTASNEITYSKPSDILTLPSTEKTQYLADISLPSYLDSNKIVLESSHVASGEEKIPSHLEEREILYTAPLIHELSTPSSSNTQEYIADSFTLSTETQSYIDSHAILIATGTI